jgi:hypothetical protein
MVKKNLEKMTREEINNKSKVAFNHLTNEEKRNLVIDYNKKMLYFDIGQFTSIISPGLSATCILAGAVYDKPEYILVGAAATFLSMMYSRSLSKDIKDYENYLNDLMDSKNYSSENKEDKDKSNFGDR